MGPNASEHLEEEHRAMSGASSALCKTCRAVRLAAMHTVVLRFLFSSPSFFTLFQKKKLQFQLELELS